jgi:hypothetical protein
LASPDDAPTEGEHDGHTWTTHHTPDGRAVHLRDDYAGPGLDVDLDEWFESLPPVPDVNPCLCGSFTRWQDLTGGWHCQRCEPLSTSRRIARRAALLRWKANMEGV